MSAGRQSHHRRTPIIAISMGDLNGIGPEIILKSTITPEIRQLCRPLLVGSLEVFEYYARRLRLRILLRESDAKPISKSPDGLEVVDVRPFERPMIEPGKAAVSSGMYAGESVERAVTLCLNGSADAMVTGPTSKETMNNAGYRFPGQTEMVAQLAGRAKPMMMMVAGTFRVALATVHLPLKEVSRALSASLIVRKLSILNSALIDDFGIRRPRVAVLGLNPHAGEGGLFGNEETRIISPALGRARRSGIIADGPFPSDGFFGTHSHARYDAVLAMYHDQGLIPLKMAGFDIGVNYSAGLPIVRTSPDHGTAYAIAGKGVANHRSMLEAIRLAVAITKNRRRA